MTLLNQTIDPYGAIHRCDHSRHNKVMIIYFVMCINFFPCPSETKRAIEWDLSLEHVCGAAAVAQKGKSGGGVSKTTVNKHRRRVF